MLSKMARADWISVKGRHFVRNGQAFRFIGAHTFPPLSDMVYFWNPAWRSTIGEYLDEVRAAGLEVIRFFGFGPYMERVTDHKEPDWHKLDTLVELCEQKGVYILWSLWDYWDYDTTRPFDWLYPFWDDRNAEAVILKTVRRFRQSKAILAWELLNEGDLHTINEFFPQLFDWTSKMAREVKTLDPDHLVTTGYSSETLREWYFERPELYGPVRDKTLTLYDRLPLDFLTFHGYGGPIDDMTDPSWYNEEWEHQMHWYVNESVALGSELDKPVIHEEWGFQYQIKEPLRGKLYKFMAGLFVAGDIDNVFNAWGREYWFKLLMNPKHWKKVFGNPKSMLIHHKDRAELEVIDDMLGKLNEAVGEGGRTR